MSHIELGMGMKCAGNGVDMEMNHEIRTKL